MNNMLPIKRPKNKARRFYDHISGFYDWITASEKNLIKEGVELLSASPTEQILEIGSGTGKAMALMGKYVSKEGALVGLDLSYKMLRKSAEKTQGLVPGAFHIQGDGAALPLLSDQFDAVFSTFTLELFSAEEIPIVLKEIKRVMKPSGRLTIVALAQEPRNLAVKLYEQAHRLFPVAVDCRPIPLIKILEENGFKIKSTKKVMNWGLPVHITLSQPS